MFENELEEHRANLPEKGSKSRIIMDYLDKENFLVFEVTMLLITKKFDLWICLRICLWTWCSKQIIYYFVWLN